MTAIVLFSRATQNISDLNATAANDFRSKCTLETCDISDSFYAYRPSLPGNATFLALFGLSLAVYLIQAFLSRRFVAFSVAMICGCVLEIIGYAGRIMSWQNPFTEVSGYCLPVQG